MQKALDQMNVLVHRAVTDITGTTGMAIIRAIVAGERDPYRLAAMRDARCHRSAEQIAQCLTGTWHEEHLFNLAMALRMYDEVSAIIAKYDAQLDAELKLLQAEERAAEPCPVHPKREKARKMKVNGELALRETLWRATGVDLTTIDGIGAESARTIITEIGLDITKFPTEKHFVSWLRLCPRVAVSGGKPLKKRPNGMGASRLAAVFRSAATALRRTASALGAAYRRQAARHSGSRAVFVTARRLATLVYRMLRFGAAYVDDGQEAYEARFQHRRLTGLQRNAAELGLALVPLQPPLPTD
jgi:transposase